MEIEQSDHDDLLKILKDLGENEALKGSQFLEMIKTQTENRLKKEPRSRRWPLK